MPDALLALIFDVDGTLADTEEAHRLAFNETFHAAGLNWVWDPELYTQLLAVAGGKERLLHFIKTCPVSLPRSLSLHGEDYQDNVVEYVAALHRDKTQRYQDMLRNGEVPLRSGVQRLLREAHASGLKLGIATTTSMTNVDALLDVAFDSEVRGWIDMIAAGEMVQHKKPAADIYQCALHGLGLRASQCIAFEDSLIGLQSATGAGLRTIITTDRYSRQRQFDGALIVLDSLGEPDAPFEVISGSAAVNNYDLHSNGLNSNGLHNYGVHSYVDLSMVRDLYANAYAENGE